jgi:hypothetical protein
MTDAERIRQVFATLEPVLDERVRRLQVIYQVHSAASASASSFA